MIRFQMGLARLLLYPVATGNESRLHPQGETMMKTKKMMVMAVLVVSALAFGGESFARGDVMRYYRIEVAISRSWHLTTVPGVAASQDQADQ